MYRKRAGFSQREVASLLGIQSAAQVSRYERFRREPTLRTVFMFGVILNQAPTELFAGLHEQATGVVQERARVLRHRIELRQNDPRLARKFAALQAITEADIDELHYEPILP
jgi:transcriptional regulator with XRE-family HTH domain